jgi:hypothetical protein
VDNAGFGIACYASFVSVRHAVTFANTTVKIYTAKDYYDKLYNKSIFGPIRTDKQLHFPKRFPLIHKLSNRKF